MDVGFVILCPDRNIAGLKNTLGSIAYHSYDRESVAIVGSDVDATELKEMKQLCPAHKGKNTITSLINLGISKLKHDWAFLLFSGSRIQPYIERKLEMFAKKENEILHPVHEGRYDFVSTSMNGVVINTKFFKEVGDFPEISMMKQDMNDFELAKMFWCLAALEKKAMFKGIVGMKIL